jgi:hypothetical protein
LVARGFVVGAAIALSCLYAFPLPGPRVEHFFGDGDGDPMIASYLQSVFELDHAIQLRRSASRNPGDAALRSLTAERARTESMMNQYRLASPSFALASKRYQCFNAVGAIVGGLIGAVLGSLAFRRTGDCDLAVARLST